MKLAMSPTREQFPLSRRKIWKKTLTRFFPVFDITLIFAIGLLILARGGADFGDALAGIIIFVGLFDIVVFFLIYWFQRWYWAVYFYDLTPDHIIIRKGPITPREITVPYERLQDVYVDQDLFDRLFKLYDVHVSSATISSGMEAHIDGLERTAAEGLKAKLLETMNRKLHG
ncbi:MAG: PH domain-containing protein [Candidatus Magasanikbacteria bacterium]|nr:PH domain-containing protein [Candidatus Magasanikbacteria bacterium]